MSGLSSKILDRALSGIPIKKQSYNTLPINQYTLLADASNNMLVKVVEHGVVPIQTERLLLKYSFDSLIINKFSNNVLCGTFNKDIPRYGLSPTVTGKDNMFFGWTNNNDRSGAIRFKPIISIGSNHIADIIRDGGDIYITGYYRDSVTFDSIYLYNKKSKLNTYFVAKYNIDSDEWVWVRTAKISHLSEGLSLHLHGNLLYVVVKYKGQIRFDTIPEMTFTSPSYLEASQLIIELFARNGEYNNIKETKNYSFLFHDDMIIGYNESHIENIFGIEYKYSNINRIYYFDKLYVVHNGNCINDFRIDMLDKIIDIYRDKNKYLLVFGRKNTHFYLLRLTSSMSIIHKHNIDIGEDEQVIYSNINYEEYHENILMVIHKNGWTYIKQYLIDERWKRILGVIKSDIVTKGSTVNVEFPGIISTIYDMKFIIGTDYYIQTNGLPGEEANDYYLGTAISNNQLIHPFRK